MKRIALALMIISPLAWLYDSVHDRLIWNVTDSATHRLGLLSSNVAEKGDYVNFDFQHPLVLDGKPVRLTKKWVCGSGDVITTQGRDIYCNGEYLGTALDRTGSGKRLELLDMNGPIPEKNALVMGDTIDSFDSRYWGLIEVAKFTKVVPLW